MNKQGLLWIILSIAMLVIVVLLGGLWLLNTKVPGGAATQAAAESPASELGPEPESRITFDPFEYTFKGSPLPGLQPVEEDKTDGYYQKDSRSVGDHEVLTFEQGHTIDTARTNIPSVTPRPQTRTQTTSTTRTTTQPPRTATTPTHAYYIQTGAYKHQSNAESNNETLTENGMAGRILTETVRGERYFTVLIGPYSSKSEAEKFLDWIKDIKGMELAQVVKDASMCGLGQTASNPVQSTLRYFREEYLEHIERKHCRAGMCPGLVVAPCAHLCPAGVEAHRYVRLVSQGNFEDAYLVVREKLPLPSVCAVACF
ncbi:MAG: hypothetical protein EHM28_12395, partial [Spirochaetaceae bacterium]